MGAEISLPVISSANQSRLVKIGAHSVPDCQASQQLLTIRPTTMRLVSLARLATIRNTVAPTMRWGQTASRLTFRNNPEPARTEPARTEQCEPNQRAPNQ